MWWSKKFNICFYCSGVEADFNHVKYKYLKIVLTVSDVSESTHLFSTGQAGQKYVLLWFTIYIHIKANID